MTPIIIDVEASGFGAGSYPIEVGLVLPDGIAHCFLIAPPRNWTHWDPQAEQVHRISRATLEAYGRDVEEVAWHLNQLLQEKTVYSDAWSFDLSWLGKLYEQAGVIQTYHIAPLRELIDERQLLRWETTKREVVDELAQSRHRASGDARILQQTYLRSLQPMA